MNFTSYFVLSTLVVAGIVAHAYVAHEQFYPAVVYLSTDKMCLAVMYNFAFAMFLLLGKVLLRVFIGTLRDLEVEQLIDSGRGFLADTILFLVFYAPTIDNREVGTVYLIQYICCVIFMKVFHLTTQIRVSHMFEVGVPRLMVNVKLVSLMCMLLTADVVALQYFYSVSSRSSTFFTWILFEALTMSTVVIVSIFKYSVHMVDLRLDSGWAGKSVCLFYIDLIHDVVSMTLFLVFMLTFFVQNPSRLPIYMMADVIQVARKLAARLKSFRRYRRISLNMELRFPDATDEEIEHDEYCVICRDSLFDGSKPKKLECGHIFHIDCLRSWLVMRQVCPTCRAEIPAEGPLASQAEGAAAAAAAADLRAAAAPQDGAGDGAAAAAADGLAAPAAGASSGSAAPAAAGGPCGAGCGHAHHAHRAPTAEEASAAASAVPQTLPTGAAAASSAAAAAAGARFGQPGAPATLGTQPWEAFDVSSGSLHAGASTLPPVSEIVDSLRQAEEVSKFLRSQTEFWMGQVRQIQQTHAAAVSAAVAAGAAPFIGPAEASAAAALAAAAGAYGEEFGPQSPLLKESPSSPEGGELAELRRLQQERWANKRGSSGSGSDWPTSPSWPVGSSSPS